MMLLDCQTCPVKDLNCADCVVTALTLIPRPTTAPLPDRWATGNDSDLTQPQQVLDPPHELPLDRAERRAVSTLVSVGLVEVEEANAARALRDATSYVPTFVDDHRRRAM